MDDEKTETCPRCNGSGEEFWIDAECDLCHGDGIVPDFNELESRIVSRIIRVTETREVVE
jgi:DnaJ-class molecular chaperone